jgi:4-amino-4-deoxy-L-arabinose transferase-like glycosyltransferase
MRKMFSSLMRFMDSAFQKGEAWKMLLLILAFASGLRLFLLISPEVIHNDGIEYLNHAKRIFSGDWSGGRVPPLYPALIAFAYPLMGNYELAGILISTVFGSLIVLPVFYLGRELFNDKIGVLSALFASVHPFLFISSGSVLTESTYRFFLTTSVLFGWKAFSKSVSYHILLFSLFTTFAYLTKPEAIGILFIFSLWVLWINPPSGKRHWKKRVGIILVALFGFLVFASPYLMKIRMETGKWGISQKIVISIGSFSEEEGVPSIDEIRRRKEFPLISLLVDPFTAIRKAGAGMVASLYKFQQVFNPLLSLFAILGWVFLLRGRNGFSIKGNLFLFMHFVFFFGLVFPFFWITRRYTSQMIALSIPWAAAGCLGFLEWFAQRFKKENVQKSIPVFFLILLVIGLFAQGRMIHGREHRLIQREMGLWMKENLDREAKMMSRMPQEAFYAELPWVRMPQGSYEGILEKAREKKIQYLVIDEEIETHSPHFLEKSKEGDLIRLFDLKKKDQHLMVFQIVDPVGK